MPLWAKTGHMTYFLPNRVPICSKNGESSQNTPIFHPWDEYNALRTQYLNDAGHLEGHGMTFFGGSGFLGAFFLGFLCLSFFGFLY